jgi:hypothetical protein
VGGYDAATEKGISKKLLKKTIEERDLERKIASSALRAPLYQQTSTNLPASDAAPLCRAKRRYRASTPIPAPRRSIPAWKRSMLRHKRNHK